MRTDEQINRECEIKLEFLDGKIPDTIRKYLISTSNSLTSTYFDTPDFILQQNTSSLRIRECAGEFVQTFKRKVADDKPSNVFSKEEYEWEIASNTLQPQLIPKELLPANLNFQLLQEIFISSCQRQSGIVKTRNCQFEIASDSGFIKTKFGKQNFQEIEFELKSGDFNEMLNFVRNLALSASTLPGLMFKADRGYQLAGSKLDLTPKLPEANSQTAELLNSFRQNLALLWKGEPTAKPIVLENLKMIAARADLQLREKILQLFDGKTQNLIFQNLRDPSFTPIYLDIMTGF